ncbi:MAG: hypothetical protein RL748_3983, partial [Pseudomonadota bacterium]
MQTMLCADSAAFAAGSAAASAAAATLAASSSLALAYSGGRDSTALLHLARAWAQQYGHTLYAFHVHHGISPNADAWAAHCQQTCERLEVPFAMERVSLASGPSVEAAARNARYAALGRMCRAHGVGLLLTAHHQDDQAETVLLQLLRGSGIATGMEPLKRAPALFLSDDIWLSRPALAMPRSVLCDWLLAAGIDYVDDESNLDPRYTRSGLRRQIMPLLAQQFPGFVERLGRSAQHVQSAQRLLQQLAEQDWQRYRLEPGAGLRHAGLQMQALRELDQDRVQNLLRYWLAQRGARMPGTAWLVEAITQLQSAREDAQVCIDYADGQFHRHRDTIYLAPRWQPADQFIKFRWQGETSLPFPAFSGALLIRPADENQPGVAADWLRSQVLQLRYREGGERL